MEKTTSGLSVTNVKKLDLKKCAVCQNVKDKRGDKKLTSTEKGRENLFRCLEILNDDKFKEIGEAEKSLVKYHINTCYARYVRSAERLEQRKEDVSGANEPEEIEENNSKENGNISKKNCKTLCILLKDLLPKDLLKASHLSIGTSSFKISSKY